MSGRPPRRLAARAHRDGLPERQAVPVGPLDDGRVHLLDVHVPDAVGITADERRAVRVPVGQVPGVQAERHVAGIGLVEEPLRLRLGFHVAVGVRMELQPHAVLLEDRPAQLVRGPDQRPPGAGVQARRAQGRPRSCRRGSRAPARTPRGGRPARRSARPPGGWRPGCRASPRPGAGRCGRARCRQPPAARARSPRRPAGPGRWAGSRTARVPAIRSPRRPPRRGTAPRASAAGRRRTTHPTSQGRCRAGSAPRRAPPGRHPSRSPS